MGHKVNDKVGDMLGDNEDKEGHPIGDNAEHKMGQRRKILWERGREVTDTVGGGRQSGRRSGVQKKNSGGHATEWETRQSGGHNGRRLGRQGGRQGERQRGGDSGGNRGEQIGRGSGAKEENIVVNKVCDKH